MFVLWKCMLTGGAEGSWWSQSCLQVVTWSICLWVDLKRTTWLKAKIYTNSSFLIARVYVRVRFGGMGHTWLIFFNFGAGTRSRSQKMLWKRLQGVSRLGWDVNAWAFPRTAHPALKIEVEMCTALFGGLVPGLCYCSIKTDHWGFFHFAYSFFWIRSF